MSSSPYRRIFEGDLPNYDTSDLRPEHEGLDKAARQLWPHIPDQIKDIIYSFAIELFDEQNRRKVSLVKIGDLNLDIKKLQNEKTVLEGSIDELNSINARLRLEIKSNMDLNEKLKWKVKSLELELKELGNKLTMSMRENFELRKVLDNSEVTAMQPNLEIEEEFKRVFEEKEALERVNANLKSRIQELEEKIKAQPRAKEKQIAPNKELIKIDLNQEIIQKLIAEKAFLEEKIIELLTNNKRTSALVNIMIEMRKQMISLGGN